MAERPTFASVTDAPCRCRYLSRAADNPGLPLAFDRRTGEYQFEFRVGKVKGALVIYHCPFCGGAAPRSKRALLFHIIPPEEQRRLNKMLDGIATLRGALRRLGKPEYDDPRGTGSGSAEGPGRAPTFQWHRTLRYEKLSEVADVWFTERADGRASWRLQGKAKRRRRRAAGRGT
jgi:hypothetical protein